MNEWKRWKIEEINKNDSAFPENLKKINDCPEKLYFRGKWSDEIFKDTLSIVGSRKMTRYGKEIINLFTPKLILNKITIISGFMYGVDSESHKTCISNNGKTIAVLGGGLDYLYPIENDNLYTEILENNGLVISEFDNNFKPTLWSFPRRNRIVSGLSTRGILIIEAFIKSGSLVTANIGNKQGKSIFAVPGLITSKSSEGTNYLIKNNLAKMITNCDDIFSTTNISKKTNEIQMKMFDVDLNIIETKIIDILSQGDYSADELVSYLNLSIVEILSNTSNLLIKNIIGEEMGKYYLIRI